MPIRLLLLHSDASLLPIVAKAQLRPCQPRDFAHLQAAAVKLCLLPEASALHPPPADYELLCFSAMLAVQTATILAVAPLRCLLISVFLEIVVTMATNF